MGREEGGWHAGNKKRDMILDVRKCITIEERLKKSMSALTMSGLCCNCYNGLDCTGMQLSSFASVNIIKYIERSKKCCSCNVSYERPAFTTLTLCCGLHEKDLLVSVGLFS